MQKREHLLKGLLRGVRPPTNYHKGVTVPKITLPDNILLFANTEAAHLTPKPEAHHRCVLLFCLEGSGQVVVDDSTHSVSPGESLLIMPYQIHFYGEVEAGQVLWLFITFETAAVHELESLRGSVWRWAPTFEADILALVEDYLAEKSSRIAEVSLRLRILLEAFRRDVSRSEPHCTSGDASLFARCAHYIVSNLSGPIRIPDLALAMSMSESSLSQAFRRAYGKSIGSFIRQARIQRARSLLRQSTLSITEVGSRCGYDTVYSFSRAFKSIEGCSPRAYREAGE